MIRVDFGENQDGPTLWLIIDTLPSFERFCVLLENLSTRKDSTVSCAAQPELFSVLPDVSNLVLSVAPPLCREGVNVKTSESGVKIDWKLRPNSWSDVSETIRGLRPATHNYVDYKNVTIFISLLEGLRQRLT